MMKVGIKQRGTKATRLIPNVIGFEIRDGFLMLDLLHKQQTFYADELVCCVPAEAFDRSKMLTFLKPGHEHKEACEDVSL